MKNRNLKHVANITITVHGSRRARGMLVVNAGYHTHDPSETQWMDEIQTLDCVLEGPQLLHEQLSTWLSTAQRDWQRQQALESESRQTRSQRPT